MREVLLVVDSAAAAVEGEGGEAPAKVRCTVAPLKELKPLRPGIQMTFCVCDPDGTPGFIQSQALRGLGRRRWHW